MAKIGNTTLFVSVIGWSGSGKTSLVVRALAECKRRGIAAAAAKRAHHEAAVAPEGKDSTAYLEAGAIASLYIGDQGIALLGPRPESLDKAFYQSLLPGAETIFLEGAYVEGAIRILVAGGAQSPSELKRPLSECDILVAADPSIAVGIPAPVVFRPDDIEAIIEYLEAHRGT